MTTASPSRRERRHGGEYPDISISYELKYEKVPEFYVKFRADHAELYRRLLRNITRDEINNVAGKYSVEEIIGDNGPIFLQVRNNLQKQLDPYGVVIDQLGVMGASTNVIEAVAHQ